MVKKEALLDTCALIYYLNGEDRMRFADEYSLQVSPICFWEMSLLVRKKRLKLTAPLDSVIREISAIMNELPLSSYDIIHLQKIEYFDEHKDPFDRVLIAQALRIKIPIITSDDKFFLYKGLEIIKV